mgnify:FL=1
MQVFIGMILGFVVAIIVMIVTGFGQDPYLIREIDEQTGVVKKISKFANCLIDTEISGLNDIKEILDITTLSEEEKSQYIQIITDVHIKHLLTYSEKIKVLSDRRKDNSR